MNSHTLRDSLLDFVRIARARKLSQFCRTFQADHIASDKFRIDCRLRAFAGDISCVRK